MNIFNRDSHRKRQVVPLANILTVISASGVSNTRMLQRSRYADMSIAEIFHALNRTSSIFCVIYCTSAKLLGYTAPPPTSPLDILGTAFCLTANMQQKVYPLFNRFYWSGLLKIPRKNILYKVSIPFFQNNCPSKYKNKPVVKAFRHSTTGLPYYSFLTGETDPEDSLPSSPVHNKNRVKRPNRFVKHFTAMI